jgi:hypothetical protein
MCVVVGFVTFSLLSSSLFASKISIFQNAFAKSNDTEYHGNATKDDVNGKNSSDKVVAQKKEEDSRNKFDSDRKLYKPTHPKIKPDSKESFTVFTEKHLYKLGENVTLAGSVWTSLLSELGDQANHIMIKVKDNKRVVVVSEEAEIDNNGEYFATFILPSNANLGAYTVQAAIQIDAKLLQTLEPSVRAKLYTSAKFVVVKPVEFIAKVEDKEYSVLIASNSTTVKEFAFVEEQSMISFKVKGDIGTRGVTQVTLPKDLLGEEVLVSIDGLVIPEDSNDVIVTSDTPNEMTLEISYHHSEHTIQLHGRIIVPPSPESSTVMPATFGSWVAIIAIVGIFLSIKYLGSKRNMGKMVPNAKRLFGYPSSSSDQKKKIDFLCLTCGTKHDLGECPKCGSKSKKAEF